jgi:hypothetical protein
VRYTDGHGLAHGRGRKRPRTGAGGSGYADRPADYVALTWHFRLPLAAVIPLFARFALEPGALGAADGDEAANADISGTRAEHEATESAG